MSFQDPWSQVLEPLRSTNLWKQEQFTKLKHLQEQLKRWTAHSCVGDAKHFLAGDTDSSAYSSVTQTHRIVIYTWVGFCTSISEATKHNRSSAGKNQMFCQMPTERKQTFCIYPTLSKAVLIWQDTLQFYMGGGGRDQFSCRFPFRNSPHLHV